MSTKLRIALPNQGRLSAECRSIFINNLHILKSEASISRRYHYQSLDGAFEFIFARSDDLPRLVAMGVVDLCITGKDYVVESGADIAELLDIDLCAGDICVLVPKTSDLKSIKDLDNKTIATQLPNLAKNWLNRKRVKNFMILANKGANEVYPYLGLADATIDIVSTGKTARSNGLESIEIIMHSSGRLFSNNESLKRYPDKISWLIENLKKEYLIPYESAHTTRRTGFPTATVDI
jgi:ATP phosphoribosyltransferase